MSSPPANRVGRPLYSIDGIVIGTLLGSLIAGVYMVMYNYATLGAFRLARQTVIVGLILFAVIILAGLAAPSNIWVALTLGLGQAGLAYLLASRLQGASISYYTERGGRVHGLFRSALVGLLAGAISLMVLGLLALVAR